VFRHFENKTFIEKVAVYSRFHKLLLPRTCIVKSKINFITYNTKLFLY